MAMSAKRRRLIQKFDGASDQTQLLQELLHTGGISKTAVKSILLKLERQPEHLPGAAAQLDEASLALFEGVKHIEKLTLVDGNEWDWELCHPSFLLEKSVAASETLQDLFLQGAVEMQDRPWSLVVAFDEYVPGSKFNLDTNRKSMNLSFSFLELGSEALSHDACWWLPVSVRAERISQVKGGWSHMIRRFLQLQLFSPLGIATAGVPLTLRNGQVYLLKARLVIFFSDGDGHRIALQWRGAGSIRPCFRHSNVLKRDAALSSRVAGFVEVDCNDPSAFLLTDKVHLCDDVKSLVEAARLHEAGALTKTNLDNMRYVTSLNVTAEGLLADDVLRDIVHDAFYYDWAHTVFQDGTFTAELTLFMRACAGKIEFTHRDWEAYLSDGNWSFPSMHRSVVE